MSGPVLELSDIETWKDAGPDLCTEIKPPHHSHPDFDVNNEINSLVSILRYSDSTRIKCDAVINRTDNTFSTGGSIFKNINKAAGPELAEACARIGRCEDCNTVRTDAFKLPCKYIIHTVGPTGEADEELEKTLDSVFSHIDGTDIRSIGMEPFYIENNAFSLMHAVQMVLQHTRKFLDNEENRKKVDRIIFINNQAQNLQIFVQLMYIFFPLEGVILDGGQSDEEEDEEEEDISSSSDDMSDVNDDIMLRGDHNGNNSEPDSPISEKIGGSSIMI